ncbi:phosphatidylserine decarboxylase [Coniophora puteana RWD-64-598 SS2]|uniref:Phosphatidylserine decarboxylase proenzyme 1, mitochondrial n=1 Tax=Coniophora puteana (strain RWD-64-598) TaxID=741705 RepID=A0A5M3N3W3_CONPW|nr:phosphatidylserine decarboxylase [Coniophora puteana RWD-64-598 SS2]EIW86063.1 phosphatidylserine decarboxylase [Coniophora puteana RWD-64-598 SS2]
MFYNTINKGKRPFLAAHRVLYSTTSKAANSSSSLLSRVFVKHRISLSGTVRSIKRGSFRRSFSVRNGIPPETNPPLPDAKLPLYRKLVTAWTDTPTKWYPLPIAVGALLLVAIQYRKKAARAEKEVMVDEDGNEVIKLKGPWQVHVIGALPLRNMSRLWGYLNSLELPVWFRPYGFRLYAFAFGCNLEEIEIEDLTRYRSLGDFFYRKLKAGARPVDNAVIVSPADGTILHFGTIENLRVEQVKGITYSLDALLGVEHADPQSPQSPSSTVVEFPNDELSAVAHQEFANVNGIEYSLDQLLGTSQSSTSGTNTPTSTTAPSPFKHAQDSDTDRPAVPRKHGESFDASVEQEGQLQDTLAHDASVAREMGMRPALERKRSTSGTSVREGNSLFFTVIYLAPGDYHRFHSPTAWVVEKRRHFVGELFSVSPYMAKRLQNLFVLNERVALLGRWRYGFFGMVPVGATNVGSIKINFDKALRTNERGRPPPPGTYTEAVYSAASPLLNGQPLAPAEEMGGFCLGSTIVLVFEAPKSFEFAIQAGQKVKVGNRLGDVPGAFTTVGKEKTE